jgi:hypothetical protein
LAVLRHFSTAHFFASLSITNDPQIQRRTT